MSGSRRRAKPLTLLHVDADLIAVDKPAGVLSVPGRGDDPSLFELIRALPEFAADEPLRIVHRLDRDASGVIVFARTLAAQRGLVRQFMDRRVEKTYYALVSGYVLEGGEVDLPIFYNKRSGQMEVSPRRGKPSCTRYSIAQRVAGNTLLECVPLTGRTHQIRLHMAAIGHPLTVDPVHGGGSAVLLSAYKPDYHASKRHAERPLIDRLTLHAARLAFEHPCAGEHMTLEAALPKDLRATVNQLSRLV
jgi:RluA family pseudouridine synthase